MRSVATASELDRAIEDLVHALGTEIRVERIVLYGSYVNGAPHEWSDFDIAIVSPDFEDVPLWRRQETIARLSAGCHPRLSPIGYPSSEYCQPRPDSFLVEILRTGKLVYQAEGSPGRAD